MTYHGIGYISKVNGNMNSELYIDIIKECIPSTDAFYHMYLKDIIFQHNNDLKHKSNMTTQFLENYKWRVLDWPPQSLDLNPIENLWKQLKDNLSLYETPPIDEDNHWKRIIKTFYDIPKDKCQAIINTMPDRTQAVLKANDGYTKY